MSKRVLFRVDGGAVRNTGTGHIFRSLLVADRLAPSHQLAFASLDIPEYRYGHDRIRRAGHPLHLLPPGRCDEALAAWVRENAPDFIVCDLYEYRESELRILKSGDAPLMTFDHFDEHRRYSDYPINAVQRDSGGPFDGPAYIVIPPPSVRPSRPSPERIFVSFGGFDYGSLTLTVARALARLDMPQAIDIVVTSLHPDIERLHALARQRPGAMTVHVQPDHFAQLLSEADVAFVSGGLTMFQALSVGASVVVITQYEHQQQAVEEFASSDAYVNLGSWHHLGEPRIGEVARCLVGDAARRERLGRNARTLVDGRGLERVVRLIADRLQE